jgi:hypothetical protein
MAIIRLTDVVATMKDKWTYGDKFFGYTEEFNDNHNTQYPSLLITPPNSTYPEVSTRNGWEIYSFEVYFSDLYNRTQQENEDLEKRWDNLQDLGNEWLDRFLRAYQGGTTTLGNVIASLDDDSLVVERLKEVANDQLLQLKMTFSWRVFSKCFTPVSIYPDQIDDLVVWLKADSGTTFDIPTKKVSAWADQSGNNNSVFQGLSANQPLRYTYDGADDKTRFEFNGTTSSLSSEVLGSELIDADVAYMLYDGVTNMDGWSRYGNNVLIDTADAITVEYIDNSNGAYAFFRDGTQSITNADLEAGKYYKLSCHFATSDANAMVQVNDGAGNEFNSSVGEGDKNIYFLANSVGGTYLRLKGFNVGTGVISNISLKELTSGLCPITGNDFTIITVAKSEINTGGLTRRVFGYRDTADSDKIVIGYSSNNLLVGKVFDNTGKSILVFGGAGESPHIYHIMTVYLASDTLSVQYNQNTESLNTTAGFDNTTGYNDDPFTIGSVTSAVAANFFDGNLQEVIVYNAAIPRADIAKIQDYLNRKYKIY